VLSTRAGFCFVFLYFTPLYYRDPRQSLKVSQLYCKNTILYNK